MLKNYISSNEVFSKWAVVAHNDDSGLGRQAHGLKQVLGIARHIVIPSERLLNKPIALPYEVMLAPQDPREKVIRALEGLDGIIFAERSNWHPHLLSVARQLNVKTICIPHWEWFDSGDRKWELCDLFACTCYHTLEFMQKQGFTNSVYVGPSPIDIKGFVVRSDIKGPARVFIHNAGLIDSDDRKGTLATIRAFRKVNSKDIRLIVRVQKKPHPSYVLNLEKETAALKKVKILIKGILKLYCPQQRRAIKALSGIAKEDARIKVYWENLENPSLLYQEGDVAIQPSKLEGAGFMVLEPMACGMPVITTDHPPMNEYGKTKSLLVKIKSLTSNCFPNRIADHKHVKLALPDIDDLAEKIKWCAENNMAEISVENRKWAEETFDPTKLRAQWQDAIQSVLNAQKEKR